MIFRRVSEWPSWNWRGQWEEMEKLRRQMDVLSGGLSGRLFAETSAGVFPLMNMTEDSDHYYVRAELPGIKADVLDISVTGDTLSISGERMILEEKENAKYHRRERESGKFSRIVGLPSQVDTTKVEASTTDGILKVILPKSEAAKPKQITVKGE
ncbi:MAG TPA: Hsp20/alpha crystallin family protein [Deltaproteobacteria bacterium]|nr:Hsp20/alpha crystallin family protein [Deltaproteobacteria bacterium]HIJ41631.1 Hsp20/alpha crystallin family protein [Deltaproteobacteria bacterium]